MYLSNFKFLFCLRYALDVYLLPQRPRSFNMMIVRGMHLFPYCHVNILETEACGMSLTQQHTKFSVIKPFNRLLRKYYFGSSCDILKYTILEFLWRGVGKAQNNYRTARMLAVIYNGCIPKAKYIQLHCDYLYEHIIIWS
jgi:hypothetical protein